MDTDKYKARMARKKSLIDTTIAEANKEKGLLLILTGNGKGKSTSAFGMLARAIGHGMKTACGQFIKGRTDTGEEAFFRQYPQITWQVFGEGFTWDTQDKQKDTEKAVAGWNIVSTWLKDPSIGLIVLDELTYAINYGYLDLVKIVHDLRRRPIMQHVVITGRSAPKLLTELADTVTEMQDIKHAYRSGIKAQVGVDW